MTIPAVESLLSSAVRGGLIPGGVAVWGSQHPGFVSAAAGTTSWRHGAGVRPGPDTIYDLASLTKPLVVGCLALMARREGLIRLEAPVGEYLSEAVGTDWQLTPIDQLLTHTSGFPAWLPLYALAEGAPDRVMRALLQVPRRTTASTEPAVYSCLGFILMGWVLERVFGSTLDQVFRNRITEPLGIADEVFFNPRPASEQRLAAGALDPVAELQLAAELGFEARWTPPCGIGQADDGNCRFMGGVSGNAGLFGSGSGVYQLGLQFLPGSSVLFSDEELRQLSSCRASVGGIRRGRAWQLASSLQSSAGPALSSGAIGHTGFTGTSLWIDTHPPTVLVLLTNRVHPVHRPTDLHPLRRRFHSLAMGEAGCRHADTRIG